MKGAAFRIVLRWLHIVLATALGVWVYSPLRGIPAADAIVMFAVFPGLGAVGVALWQQARIRRMLE